MPFRRLISLSLRNPRAGANPPHATLEKTLLEPFGFVPSVQTGAQGFTSVTQTIHNVQQRETRSSDPISNREVSADPELVEVNGFEPMTPCLQSRCSPS